MKRRAFLKTAAIGAASAAVASPAVAQTMPSVKWRLTSSYPKSLDTVYGACTRIAKRVAGLTDNKFEIQAFAAGEIVPPLQVLDAVQNGTVECGHTTSFFYVGKDPTFAFGWVRMSAWRPSCSSRSSRACWPAADPRSARVASGPRQTP